MKSTSETTSLHASMGVIGPRTYLGTPVFVSSLLHPIPKLRVNDDCPMTDVARNDMNVWLLETFGVRDSVYFVEGKGMFVSPENYERMRREGWQ
jgi:hypothetical protein